MNYLGISRKYNEFLCVQGHFNFKTLFFLFLSFLNITTLHLWEKQSKLFVFSDIFDAAVYEYLKLSGF